MNNKIAEKSKDYFPKIFERLRNAKLLTVN